MRERKGVRLGERVEGATGDWVRDDRAPRSRWVLSARTRALGVGVFGVACGAVGWLRVCAGSPWWYRNGSTAVLLTAV